MDPRTNSKIPLNITQKKKVEKGIDQDFLNYSLFNLGRNILKNKYGFPASKRLANVHKR